MSDPRVSPLSRLLTALLFLAAGCSGAATTPELHIEEAWARPAPFAPAVTTSPLARTAAYLTIRNTGRAADRLIGAEADVARVVELHESRIDGGVMRMRPVEHITIDPGASVTLAPGGYHLMLLDLTGPLQEGDHFTLTLNFAQRGALSTPVIVETR
ncbi:hypothetical protein AWN76_001600 [Rhodothermaceae bacterium RA]|nr:hypothetical protein AWN76_001600 [Rhodothermaceae bacterium RA]